MGPDHDDTPRLQLTVEDATTRLCGDCRTTPGERVRDAFSFEGRSYPESRTLCATCKGAPNIPQPNYRAIVATIRGRSGGLRSKRPDDRVSYYVWRMARFHGGADVTMPMTAMMEIGKHPWLPELDALADRVASRVFGTDLVAAHRWGRALGHLTEDSPGLPPSAYSCGPVADEHKPIEEAAELL